MFDVRLPIVVLVCALLGGCSKSSSSSHDGVQRDPATVLTQVITQGLAAADVFLAEGPTIDETLARQQAKLTGARVDRRLPVGDVKGAAIRDVLTAYAKMHGLGAVQVKLATTDTGPPVPTSHPGDETYAYETPQLVGTAPIAITVASNDRERLNAFFKAMVKLQLPLMVLPTLLVDASKAVYSGSVHFRRKVTPPKRSRKTPSLAEIAVNSKVSLPEEIEKLKVLTSLHAQLISKDAAVVALLAKQDTIAQRARVLQFLRSKAKEIASQKVPKVVGVPPNAAPVAVPESAGKSGTTP